MNFNKIILYANVFFPLDLLYVSRCPHLCSIDIFTQVPKFDGNPWLASNHLEYFMNYVVNTNIFYEDLLMKTFAMRIS
jgi:hypothetical protein